MAVQVYEGSRTLDSWTIDLCEDSGEWAVEHYVGGEEFMIFDGFFPTRESALKRMRELNAEGAEHKYYRDWEGDAEMEYAPH